MAFDGDSTSYGVVSIDALWRFNHPLRRHLARACGRCGLKSSGVMKKGIPLVCDWKMSQF